MCRDSRHRLFEFVVAATDSDSSISQYTIAVGAVAFCRTATAIHPDAQ